MLACSIESVGQLDVIRGLHSQVQCRCCCARDLAASSFATELLAAAFKQILVKGLRAYLLPCWQATAESAPLALQRLPKLAWLPPFSRAPRLDWATKATCSSQLLMPSRFLKTVWSDKLSATNPQPPVNLAGLKLTRCLTGQHCSGQAAGSEQKRTG